MFGSQRGWRNYAQLHKYLAQYSVDISHFTGRGWSKGLRGIGKPRLSLKDILVKKSTFQSYKLKKTTYCSRNKKWCMRRMWLGKNVTGWKNPT